jgi:hypothetical protein
VGALFMTEGAAGDRVVGCLAPERPFQQKKTKVPNCHRGSSRPPHLQRVRRVPILFAFTHAQVAPQTHAPAPAPAPAPSHSASPAPLTRLFLLLFHQRPHLPAHRNIRGRVLSAPRAHHRPPPFPAQRPKTPTVTARLTLLLSICA